MLSDQYRQEGFEAHGQNVERCDNPYLNLARLWDEGWSEREKQRRKHHLLSKDSLSAFGEFVAGELLP